MTIVDLETLIDHIQPLDTQSQVEYIKAYVSAREKSIYEQGYAAAWKQCIKDQKKLRSIKRDRIKNAILNYDEENGYIELVDFVKFFYALDDELKRTMEQDENSRYYAENLHDFLWNIIEKVKVDRRFLFRKDE